MQVQAQMRTMGMLVGVLVCGACGVTDEGLPPDVRDPAAIQTPAGAIGYYQQVVTTNLSAMFDPYLAQIAVMTDEVGLLPVAIGAIATTLYLHDSRHDLSFTLGDSYRRLHKLRAQARDARGFLGAYAPESSTALRGHLYALEGYAETFLADLFCSGIPLSTVDFQGDYTLASGSSTLDVYRHALALLDTALTLGSDSAKILHLSAVGRGRALLGQGRYAEAAAAVAIVPDSFQYRVVPAPVGTSISIRSIFAGAYAGTSGRATVGDGDGLNGLDYRSSNDPRTRTALLGTDQRGFSGYGPMKYQPFTGSSATLRYTMASGVEARLIEAEAALQAGDPTTWLAKLNQPRQSLVMCGAIVPATTCPLSTLEDPGATLTDPATALAARVDLLFRERAFWLYLTGHRQGDLRRLIRQYGREPNTVYPSGAYAGDNGFYGNELVVPVRSDIEGNMNPKYTGCSHRNA